MFLSSNIVYSDGQNFDNLDTMLSWRRVEIRGWCLVHDPALQGRVWKESRLLQKKVNFLSRCGKFQR